MTIQRDERGYWICDWRTKRGKMCSRLARIRFAQDLRYCRQHAELAAKRDGEVYERMEARHERLACP